MSAAVRFAACTFPNVTSFHYVYGLLHHPGYRQKYADNLKRELPRIPFAPDFRALAKAGEKLAKLHLDYEKPKPWDLDFIETPGLPLNYQVEDKVRLSKDKRSGITSNPNREDDPEYIARLVGQVVRVSVETVKLVSGLPAEFEPK